MQSPVYSLILPQLVYILSMKLIKADDYQTWFIEKDNKSIIIDPWLTKTLQPEGTFFIQRRKKNPTCLSEDQVKNISGIVITAPFEDHLHIESNNHLERYQLELKFHQEKLNMQFQAAGQIESFYFHREASLLQSH